MIVLYLILIYGFGWFASYFYFFRGELFGSRVSISWLWPVAFLIIFCAAIISSVRLIYLQCTSGLIFKTHKWKIKFNMDQPANDIYFPLVLKCKICKLEMWRFKDKYKSCGQMIMEDVL